MLQIAQSQHLTGQCPQCGWTPPPQNHFRPNIFHEYKDSNGRIVILSEGKDRIESEAGVFLRHRDDDGHVIMRMPEGAAPQVPQQQAQQIAQQPPPQNIMPSRDIPPALVKTPAEVAATPKEKVTPSPVALPTPVMSGDTTTPKQP